MEQLGQESEAFRVEVAKFLDDLVSHLVFDDGKLVVAHAGLKESMHGRGSGQYASLLSSVRPPARRMISACLSATTGLRTIVARLLSFMDTRRFRNLCSSTTQSILIPAASSAEGSRHCAIQNAKSFLSKPTGPTTSPLRPFLPNGAETPRPLQHAQDDVLDLADVVGKRLIDTRLKPKITIREENAIAALEVMSRFASDPKWLIYLPPTMSPTETSKHENLLEHPDEAFAFYRKEGISTVVCEQKHMGSRAVVVLCKDESVSQKRFGVVQPSLGTVYTRTGRRFFTDDELGARVSDSSSSGRQRIRVSGMNWQPTGSASIAN